MKTPQKPRTFASRRRSTLLAAICSISLAAGAQEPRSHHPRVDVALTFSAAYSAHTGSGASFWLEGGGVDLHAPLTHGLGVVAAATGLHVQSNSAAVAPLDLVTIVFGPRYTLSAHHHVSVFAEALAGEAHGFHSIFAYGSGPTSNPANGTTTSANALALQTGGGIDFRLTHRLALRAIQVDYLRTQLPNGQSNLQTNIRYASGLDLRF